MGAATDIKLICFDLGRVLVRICDDWQHAAQNVQLSARLPELSDHQFAEMTRLIHAADTGGSDTQTFCTGVADIFGLDPAVARRMHDGYIRGTYPGAAELLVEIHRAGYPTACLSNTNENHWRIMFESDDPDYAALANLGQRFASHLIGHRKPQPGIYEHLERTMSLRPSQIVFFDDLPDNIAAASTRGWQAIQIADDGDPVTQMRGHLYRLGVLGR